MILSIDSNIYIEDVYRGQISWPNNPYQDPVLQTLRRLEVLAKENGMNIKFSYPSAVQCTCYSDLDQVR